MRSLGGKEAHILLPAFNIHIRLYSEFEAMLEVSDESLLKQKSTIKEETVQEESSHDLTDVSESTIG
jgi:hypothetical protein